MNEALKEQLVKQITIELESSYKYLAMASYFSGRSLNGIANWMRVQAQEELAHADKIHNYLQDLGVDVAFGAIEAQKHNFSSCLDAFEHALKQEIFLKEVFEKMANTAREASDNTSYTFIEWFLTEQVEEIATCQTVIDRLKIAGEDGYGLLMIDQELGARKPEEEEM